MPKHFDVERVPISAPRLEERLKMLAEEDAQVVRQWTGFLNWDRQVLDRTDEDVAKGYHEMMARISNETLREMIEFRMDTRTIIAAVRRRRAGLPPPTGVGQWVEQIRGNYDHPEFRLQGRFGWIGKLDQALQSGEAMVAQRLLFEANYRNWARMAERFTFSFEAVLLYLARWEIIDRWTSRNESAGKLRFETMITETLGEYAHLFK
ncbi:MAG: DUF2764 family protein [Pirellulaceae bacterium]|nr:DUF2764 family protein [Pirellulaceae bacterium]